MHNLKEDHSHKTATTNNFLSLRYESSQLSQILHNIPYRPVEIFNCICCVKLQICMSNIRKLVLIALDWQSFDSD